MGDARGSGVIAGVARAVSSLTRSLGGRSVMLRMPAAAVAEDAAQLGLRVPVFQDVPLEPAVLRRVQSGAADGARWELLVGADAMETVAGPLGYAAVKSLLADVCGVVSGDVVMELTEVQSAEAFGVVYLYRLRLREPLA